MARKKKVSKKEEAPPPEQKAAPVRIDKDVHNFGELSFEDQRRLIFTSFPVVEKEIVKPKK